MFKQYRIPQPDGSSGLFETFIDPASSRLYIDRIMAIMVKKLEERGLSAISVSNEHQAIVVVDKNASTFLPDFQTFIFQHTGNEIRWSRA